MLENFLHKTRDAMTKASEVHSRNPFEGVSGGRVPVPAMPNKDNRKHPFSPSDAHSALHSVGVGNSSNIVVDQTLYDDALRMVTLTDDQAGQDLFQTSMAIEELCSRIFVVPDTVPGVMSISDRMKNSLGEFRSLTEDTNMHTRRFVDEIRQIDGANGMFVFVCEQRAAAEVINRVTTEMSHQAESMRATANSYRDASMELRDKADDARKKAGEFRQTIGALRQQISHLRTEAAMSQSMGSSFGHEVNGIQRQLNTMDNQIHATNRQIDRPINTSGWQPTHSFGQRW